MRIFKCKKCGNIVLLVKEGTCIPKCCEEEMQELKANTTDGAMEKHVPVVEKEDQKITVTCGEVLHPMEEKHYIEFIAIETNLGVSLHYLKPGEEPVARFHLVEKEEFLSAYAYCNLHGLWKNKD